MAQQLRALLILVTVGLFGGWTHGSGSSPQAWTPILIGGGGETIGGGANYTSGVQLVWTDSAGAFVWNPTAQVWTQLFAKATLPTCSSNTPGFWGDAPTNSGGYCPTNSSSQIKIAPVATEEVRGAATASVAYAMTLNTMLASTNMSTSGAAFTWSGMGLESASGAGGTVGAINWGSGSGGNAHASSYEQPKIGVDPCSSGSGHVLVGVQAGAVSSASNSGVWETFTGTSPPSTWQQVAASLIPFPANATPFYFPLVIFDPTSCSGGFAQVAYAYTSNAGAPGIYRATNLATVGGASCTGAGTPFAGCTGAANWTLISSSPATVQSMTVAPNDGSHANAGTLYVVDGASAVNGNVTSWTSGSGWTTLLSSCCESFALNPLNTFQMAAQASGGTIYVSNASTGVLSNTAYSYNVVASAGGPAWDIGGFFAHLNLYFDPLTSGNIITSISQSVMKVPFANIAAGYTFTNISQGIESNVVVSLAPSPGGHVIVGVEDNSLFYMQPSIHPTTYASYSSPVAQSIASPALYDVHYPPGDWSWAVGLITFDFNAPAEFSGFSTDGFQTFANTHPFNNWYSIIPSSPTSLTSVSQGSYPGCSTSTCIEVTLPSPYTTASLAAQSVGGPNGLNTIACTYSDKVQKTVGASVNVMAVLSGGDNTACYPILSVIDSTHFVINASYSGTSGLTASGSVAAGSHTFTTSACTGAPAAGWAYDVTQSYSLGGYASCAAGTVTMNGNTLGAITSGDTILFSSMIGTGGNYQVYTPSPPLSSYFGGLSVINVSQGAASVVSGDFLVRVTLLYNTSTYSTGQLVCFTGVVMTSTTFVNGCWTVASTGTTGGSPYMDLLGSSFVSGDSYISGGVGTMYPLAGGYIAAADENKIVTVPAGQSQFPRCTTNQGQAWSELGPSIIQPNVYGTVTAGPYNSGTSISVTLTSTALPITGQIFIQMSDGRYYQSTVSSHSGTSPEVITLANAIPTFASGNAIANGANVYTDGGWGFDYYSGQHRMDVDQVTANRFYAFNAQVGFVAFSACPTSSSQVTIINTANVLTAGNSPAKDAGLSSDNLRTVPGQAGQVFYTAGSQGSALSNHPVNIKLWRTCQGGTSTPNGANFYAIPELWEVRAFAIQAASPGNFPAIWVIGFLSLSDAISGEAGLYRTTIDPNSGNTGNCNVGGAITGSIAGNVLTVSSIVQPGTCSFQTSCYNLGLSDIIEYDSTSTVPYTSGQGLGGGNVYITGSAANSATCGGSACTGNGGTGTYLLNSAAYTVAGGTSFTLSGNDWVKVASGMPGDWASLPSVMACAPDKFGLCYFGTQGAGAFWAQYNYLLQRDIDPKATGVLPAFMNPTAANDNWPTLSKAA